jgi:hypothetical protein
MSSAQEGNRRHCCRPLVLVNHAVLIDPAESPRIGWAASREEAQRFCPMGSGVHAPSAGDGAYCRISEGHGSVARHLGHWLALSKVAIADIDEGVIDRLARHRRQKGSFRGGDHRADLQHDNRCAVLLNEKRTMRLRDCARRRCGPGIAWIT